MNKKIFFQISVALLFFAPVLMAQKVDEEDIRLWRKLGVSYYLEFNYEEAVNKLDFVLKHKTKDAEAFYMRGVSKAKLGNYKSAARDLEQAIAIDSLKAEYHYRHGRYLYKINKTKDAIASLRTAQRLEPKNPVHFYYGAACLKKMGDKNAMCKDLYVAKNLKLAKATSLFDKLCAPYMKQ
ncbi:MAG: tetratricopeptide repeat protein [Flavobacteriales bacterium]|nr:tetratricopeptide repeat protein [Flavobacteriales bacterium]